MSFVNLCSLFLTKCMDDERFELQTLFESIFQHGGDALISDRKKTIEREVNPKEPTLMAKLEKGLRIVNMVNICDLDGRFVQFDISHFSKPLNLFKDQKESSYSVKCLYLLSDKR